MESESFTVYSTEEYLTTKDAERIFERPSLEINALLRAARIERAATYKRPGQKGRPANLYRRADVTAFLNYVGAFSLEG